MTTNPYLKPRTFTYGLSLGFIAIIGTLLKILNYYPQSLFILIQFVSAFALIIYPVIRYKNSPRSYLLPIKILSIALVILTLSSLIFHILTMDKDFTSKNLIIQIGEKLPSVISSSIIFATMCLVPLLVATIIGFVIKKDLVESELLIDDHLT